MAERELYIGVMSGTSLDGVDTALVALQDDNIELLAHHDYPMPADLKQRLLNVCIGQPTTLIAMGELEHDLGHLFSDAVLALLQHSGYRAEHIRAIGCHGQTVFHQLPAPNLLPCKLAMQHYRGAHRHYDCRRFSAQRCCARWARRTVSSRVSSHDFSC